MDELGNTFLTNEAGQIMQEQIDFNKDQVSDLKIDSDDFKQKIISIDREIEAVNEAVMTNTQFTTELHFKLSETTAHGKAEIFRLEQVQANDRESHAKFQQQVNSEFEHVAADVLNVQESLAKSNEAFAQQIGQVRAEIESTNDEVGIIKGRVTTVEKATVDLKSAQASLEQSTVAEFGEMRGYITHIEQAFSDSEKALVESIGQTQAQVNLVHNENRISRSRIIRTEKALATETEARAEDKVQIDARFDDAEGAIVTIKEVQARQDEALAKTEEQLRAEIQIGDEGIQGQLDEQGQKLSSVSSLVDEQKTAIANLNETTTQIKQTQQSQHEDTQASIGKLTETTASTDKALTEAKEQSKSRFEDNESSITHIQQTMSNEELAQVEAIGQLTAQQNVQGTEILRAKASITRIDKVVADNDHAYAQSFEKISTQFDGISADITTIKKSVSDSEKAQAEVNELIKSEISENASAIELRGQTIFDHKGNGSAIYTIKTGINWNGQYYDAKFMMGATVKNGKVVTQIGFSADTFGIFNPSSGKLEPVFFVENGQVFINEAFINKATIEKIIVGTDMRSKNYVQGKQGSRIDMEKSIFEFNGAPGVDRTTTINNEGVYLKRGNIYILELGEFK